MLNCLLCGLTAFAIVVIAMPILLPLLHKMKFGQVEREEGPESHKVKQGTPTMGGLAFILAIIIAALVFGLNGSSMVLPSVLAVVGFGLLGFLDDFIKVSLKRNLGLRAYQKMAGQILLAGAIAIWAYLSPDIGSTLYLPFSGKSWDLQGWYIPFAMFVILAETNAVNLIDGLDGLSASVTTVYSFSMVIVFMVLAKNAEALGLTMLFTDYIGMSAFSVAIVGALIGFLLFNSYPAKVFMGDTGSLALGGAVSVMALTSRSAILLPVMGICFVATALSVVLQVGYFKITHGKRIFKMAPLHHHFELSGWHETKIVSVYTIVTILCCSICLLSYIAR